MSEKKISYMNRSFEDYKKSLTEMIKTYYPDIANDFDDASIGSWIVDLVSAVADNLSYHIDSVYSETNIDTARQINSLFSIARTNGFKVPGPTSSMVELTFSVVLPTDGNKPDYRKAPIIRANSKVKAGNGTYFETLEDVNFSEQFNSAGVSNRTAKPYGTSNSNITHYVVTKTVMAVSGESLILKEVVNPSMSVPFYEFVLPFKNIIGVDSIIFKSGCFNNDPSSDEFSIDDEHVEKDGVDIYRYFEVKSLCELYRWGDKNVNENRVYGAEEYISNGNSYVTYGEWKALTQKFITEYNENGYLKITFGSGENPNQNLSSVSKNSLYARNVISKMVYNANLGKRVPTGASGMTMYIKYRVGGGKESNVAANTITTLANIDYSFTDSTMSEQEKVNIYSSITVTNRQPSVSGNGSPNTNELRNMIKYNNSAQERCVTVKDYENRLRLMPSRYGCVFRVSAVEENNKVMLYILNLDHDGKLTKNANQVMVHNMTEYLSKYRTMNDFVEIKPARIINVGFDLSVFVDKTYTVEFVVRQCIDRIREYMDVNSRDLGEDLFIGDLEKEIGRIDGVLNLINLDVYNIVGDGTESTDRYSTDMTTQPTTTVDGRRYKILLDETDYMLYSNSNEMFEIRNPENDIRVFVKTR